MRISDWSSDVCSSDINEADEQADALTRSEAADEAPGVAEVRSSFQVTFLLFGLVVPLVTGLFFLIITFQKSRSLTLLRAIGAPGALLVRSLLVQVVIVVGGGVILGTALYAPLSRTELGSLALSFDRSEEHTSELQSLMRISYAVFCLKKKKKNTHK